ncbi:hypothetical protein M758_10G168100 [Ceratodon purpureus]|nr:hypothetical protein M758_10G168100 [Ceratodon purpureus]
MFLAALEIIVYSAVFCLPVLLPIAATDKNNVEQKAIQGENYTYSDFDNLGMGNIRPNSPRIWAFLIAVYWVTIVTYYCLWKSYRKVFQLRNSLSASAVARPQQYTVLVRDIPATEKHESRTEQVDAFFRRTHPAAYERCMIMHNFDKAEKLYTERETATRKLEHAEAVFELSRKAGGDGVRPMHKTGTLGLVGPKVDSIDFWTKKIQELTPLLEEERKVVAAESKEDAALVFFNDRLAAAEAAQSIHAAYALQWQVEPAAEPRECIWSNMHLPAWQRSIRQPVVYVITFLTVVFYMIPIAAISALTTLENLVKLVPFIKTITDIKVLNAILQAFLPQLALLVFLALLPKLLLALSKAEGIPSQSHIVRAAAGKYFYFMVFNVFLGVTIFGAVFSSIQGFKVLIKQGNLSVSKVVELFGAKLPPVATFYITYVALKFFIGYGLQISRIIPLIIYHIKRKFLCKTEREHLDAWAPGPFSYHTSVPADLLIMTVTLCYSVIAPIIFVFAFLYFFIGWLCNRNAALNVNVPDWESNGRMWPHIHNRFLAALLVSQITALGYFAVKKFPYTVFLIFPIIATYAFYLYCKRNFYPSFAVVSLEVASQPVKETPSTTTIVEAYTPTCLLDGDKFEDAEFQDARSNMTSRSNSGITSPAERNV